MPDPGAAPQGRRNIPAASLYGPYVSSRTLSPEGGGRLRSGQAWDGGAPWEALSPAETGGLLRAGQVRVVGILHGLTPGTLLDIGSGRGVFLPLLEVLEHVPDAACALAEAVRVARCFVVLSVPSRAEDNHLIAVARLPTSG